MGVLKMHSTFTSRSQERIDWGAEAAWGQKSMVEDVIGAGPQPLKQAKIAGTALKRGWGRMK